MLWRRLNDAHFGDVFGKFGEHSQPKLRSELFTSAKLEFDFDFVARAQKSHHLRAFGLVVMRVDFRRELNFFDYGVDLVLTRFTRFHRSLILEFAVIHDFANWWVRVSSDLHEVKICFLRNSQRIVNSNDSDLLAVRSNQPDFRDANSVIDAGLDADEHHSFASWSAGTALTRRASLLLVADAGKKKARTKRACQLARRGRLPASAALTGATTPHERRRWSVEPA